MFGCTVGDGNPQGGGLTSVVLTEKQGEGEQGTHLGHKI